MKILEWVLAVLLALVLLWASLLRVFSSDFRSDMADSLSVPGWFLILVSILELGLVVALVLPRFRILGGLGSFVTMVGAAIFNAFGEKVGDVDPAAGLPSTIVLALIGLVVAWLAAGRPGSVSTLFSSARQQVPIGS